jgi:hypothetical protein
MSIHPGNPITFTLPHEGQIISRNDRFGMAKLAIYHAITMHPKIQHREDRSKPWSDWISEVPPTYMHWTRSTVEYRIKPSQDNYILRWTEDGIIQCRYHKSRRSAEQQACDLLLTSFQIYEAS